MVRLEERLRLLSESVRAFAEATTDLDRLLGEIVRRIAESLHDACSLWLLSDDGVTLQMVSRHHIDARGRDQPGIGASMSLDTQPMLREVLDTGQALLLARLDIESLQPQTTPLSYEIIKRLGIHSMLVVPLRVQGRRVGLMMLTRDGAASPAFDEHDRTLGQNLADHAALTIMNARAFAAERSAREALTEADRVLFELSPVAMYVIDRDLARATAVNRAALLLYGYSREEFLCLPIDVLRPGTDGAETRTHLQTLADGDADASGLTWHQRKDGTSMDVEYMSRPTTFRGRPSLLSVVVDITDRNRMEDQRRQIGALDTENQRIQEASRLKSEFLANMSHELRTPLNAVIGFTALMYAGKAGPISDTQKEYLGDVLVSSRHLLQLINDVLDLAKVESGHMTLSPAAVDVASVINEVHGILSGAAAEKQISISTHIDPALAGVVTDVRALKQILYNYLSNAIKFTAPHGTVTLRAVPDGLTFFLLEVTDTGIGVKPEDIPRLFVEFQQLDSGLAKHFPGTGLGLALTKRTVEALGGTVSVQSALGKGSCFSARLPGVAMVGGL
jgi:PAS domain S-box-containing protein